MHELPWGAVLRFCIVVPKFASGNDHQIVRRGRFGKASIVQRAEVECFKRHVAAALREVLSKMRRENSAFAAIQFPVDGKTALVRLDLYFGFRPDEDGSHRRLKLSDGDNLRKTTQDALQGVLYDNDRYVTEGFTAIGYAPDRAEGDVIWVTLSRAGYRQGNELEAIHKADNFAVIPPWRPSDQQRSALILPGRRN